MMTAQLEQLNCDWALWLQLYSRQFACRLSESRCESMRRDTPAMQQHMRDHTEEIECLSRRAQ
jgi:hypothetical protein